MCARLFWCTAKPENPSLKLLYDCYLNKWSQKNTSNIFRLWNIKDKMVYAYKFRHDLGEKYWHLIAFMLTYLKMK